MATTTQRLLDRIKEVFGVTSDYEAAKRLDVTRATVSRWRHGGTMDDATALKIALELGADPLEVLAEVRLDRKMSSRDRRIWEQFRGRLHAAALVALAAGITLWGETADASVTPQTASQGFDSLYIMRRLITVTRWLKSCFSGLTAHNGCALEAR